MISNTNILKQFITENDTNFTLDSVNKKEKESILVHCIQQLEQEDNGIPIVDCLSCLRILTRDDGCLDRLTCKELLNKLVFYAFPAQAPPDDKSIVESLKCLSNLTFKRPTIIFHLKSQGVVEQLLARLKQHVPTRLSSDILLLDLKLVFLLSGLESSIRKELAQNAEAFQISYDLLVSLNSNALSTIDYQVVSDILKVAYNIAYAIHRESSLLEHHIPHFNAYCEILRKYLSHLTLSQSDQRRVVEHVVNFLNVVPKRSFVHMLFPRGSSESECEEQEEMCAIQVLLNFLDLQLSQHCELDRRASVPTNPRLNESLGPILNTLIRAAQGNRAIRKYCRAMVLPHLGAEVKRLPEEGTTLRNRLCKLLTNPVHGVSELVALFLFVLCKEDIGRAIKYTGFGNFAGFLARHALFGGASKKRMRRTSGAGETSYDAEGVDDSMDEYSSHSSASDTEEYARLKDNVNPVTGRWELPQPHPMEGMSEEQKEYITMELVRDIDRLQRGGIIQPGTIGNDGLVKPAEHVLELLENAHVPDEKNASDSD